MIFLIPCIGLGLLAEGNDFVLRNDAALFGTDKNPADPLIVFHTHSQHIRAHTRCFYKRNKFVGEGVPDFFENRARLIGSRNNMKIHLSRFRNQVLGALHIFFAGQLHLDLVGAKRLDNRLFRFKIIDAARDLLQHNLLHFFFNILIRIPPLVAVFVQHFLRQIFNVEADHHMDTALQIQPEINDLVPVTLKPTTGTYP